MLEKNETIQNSMVVILSGYLESFLHELAEAYVGQLAGCGLAFASFPDAMRKAYFIQGAEALIEAARSDFGTRNTWIVAPPDDIARRLGGPFSGTAAPHDLLWEAFGHTAANPSAQTLKEYLKRCGVREPGKSIADAVRAEKFDFTMQMNSFISVRNECAHTGTPATQVTPSVLKSHCDLLDVVASSMVALLEDRLAQEPFFLSVGGAGTQPSSGPATEPPPRSPHSNWIAGSPPSVSSAPLPLQTPPQNPAPQMRYGPPLPADPARNAPLRAPGSMRRGLGRLFRMLRGDR